MTDTEDTLPREADAAFEVIIKSVVNVLRQLDRCIQNDDWDGAIKGAETFVRMADRMLEKTKEARVTIENMKVQRP